MASEDQVNSLSGVSGNADATMEAAGGDSVQQDLQQQQATQADVMLSSPVEAVKEGDGDTKMGDGEAPDLSGDITREPTNNKDSNSPTAAELSEAEKKAAAELTARFIASLAAAAGETPKEGTGIAPPAGADPSGRAAMDEDTGDVGRAKRRPFVDLDVSKVTGEFIESTVQRITRDHREFSTDDLVVLLRLVAQRLRQHEAATLKSLRAGLFTMQVGQDSVKSLFPLLPEETAAELREQLGMGGESETGGGHGHSHNQGGHSHSHSTGGGGGRSFLLREGDPHAYSHGHASSSGHARIHRLQAVSQRLGRAHDTSPAGSGAAAGSSPDAPASAGTLLPPTLTAQPQQVSPSPAEGALGGAAGGEASEQPAAAAAASGVLGAMSDRAELERQRRERYLQMQAAQDERKKQMEEQAKRQAARDSLFSAGASAGLKTTMGKPETYQ